MLDPLINISVRDRDAIAGARRRAGGERELTRQVAESVRAAGAPAVVVSTCERFEVFAAGEGSAIEVSRIVAGVGPVAVRRGEAAAAHLCRVAAGLDSRILGETHVLGQVAQALATARARGDASPLLTAVFESALLTGRRVRARTLLGQLASTYVAEAARYIERTRGPLAKLSVGVIGSGALGRDLLEELRGRGAARVLVFARHLDRAVVTLGAELGWVRLVPLSVLGALLPSLDVAIAATSSPSLLLDAQHVERRDKPLTAIDLGMPPNFSENLRSSSLVTTVCLDDLADNKSMCASVVRAAEEIVVGEVVAWRAMRAGWLRSSASVVLEAVA